MQLPTRHHANVVNLLRSIDGNEHLLELVGCRRRHCTGVIILEQAFEALVRNALYWHRSPIPRKYSDKP